MNTIVALPIAAAVPTAAPALPAFTAQVPATPHPDAELLALVEEFIPADRKYRELRERFDGMKDAYRYPERGKMPEVLRWRPSDRKLGLPPLYVCKAIPKPNWDAEIQVCSIRPRKWITGTTLIYRSGGQKPEQPKRINHYVTPSKAARRRADEIIEAYDNWAKELTPPRGLKKLAKERDKADRIATRLEARIYETRATTMEGLLAKVRAGTASLFCKPEQLETIALDEISGCADTMADSIFRDLLRLAPAAPLVPAS